MEILEIVSKKIVFIAILLPVLMLIGISVFGSKLPQPKVVQKEESTGNLLSKLDTPQSSTSGKDNYQINSEGTIKKELPKMTIDQNKKYVAKLNTTAGQITLELNAAMTPITVNNFVSLAKSGFYDGTIFHRVIKNFMIQGGDPEGTGAGGPGYSFADEPFTGEYTRGTIAMANAGPNTNGSQFFILHQDYPLPKKYVIFGKTTDGLDTIDRIAESEVKVSPNGEPSVPVNPVKINSVEIIESD